MIASFILVGFIVGMLVGLTGMGGGLVMTPLLIFFFGVSPAVAVGTDLIYAGITKIFGFIQHWRQKTVHLETVKWMAISSIPGAISGVIIIKWLLLFPDQSELILGKILGVTFVVVSALMVSQMINQYRSQYRPKMEQPTKRKLGKGKLMGIGMVGGTLVGMTSVGSGSIFIALLSSMGSFAPAMLVGTDIAHAAILTLVAGSAHAMIGTVNFGIIGYLLVGSIPGIIIGSRLAVSIPEKFVKSGLILILFLTGVKLL